MNKRGYMKKSLLTVLILSSFIVQAKPVEGTMTYKLPSGELATRDVTIDVPAKGQGEVSLNGKSFTWKTKKFGSFTRKNQTTFWSAFKSEYNNKKFTYLFVGTYLKGSNKLIYAGNYYKKKGHSFNLVDIKNIKKMKHVGLFNFEYLR